MNNNLLLYFLLIVVCLCLLSCKAYESRIHSTDYSTDLLIEVLENIEKNQRDSNHFAELGRNQYSNKLSIMLFITALIGGLIAVIEGSKLWSKTSKIKLVILLFLSISVTASSSTSLYLKSESDRFFQEDRDKYSILSLEMNDVIRDFYLSFRRSNFDDESIQNENIRQEFIDLSDQTLKNLSNLRRNYAEQFRLNTN